MRPSGRIPQTRLQLSRSGSSNTSNSRHFHCDSVTDSPYFEGTRTQTNLSRPIRTDSRPIASRHNTPQREDDMPTPLRREDLGSINEKSLQEDEVGFPAGVQVESDSQEGGNSEFTFHYQKPETTAQKSRFSRLNNSDETSSQEGCGEDRPKVLDETFSYDVSKMGKEHQFQFCETPKPPKELKMPKEGKADDDKQRLRRTQQMQESRMTFVKYESVETEEGRRYPYRASRAVPRLKYWEGERSDPINQGYWRRTFE